MLLGVVAKHLYRCQSLLRRCHLFFLIPTLLELFKPNLLPLKTPQKNNSALIP